jgi:TonB family protein
MLEWAAPLPARLDTAALDYLARTIVDSVQHLVPTSERERQWVGRVAFAVHLVSIGSRDIAIFGDVRQVGERSAALADIGDRVEALWPRSIHVRIRDRVRPGKSLRSRLGSVLNDAVRVDTLAVVEGVVAFRPECVAEIPATEADDAPVETPETPYFEFQVEKQASPYSGNPRPLHPDMLRSANIEGEVLAQFVVDTTGRADMTTFKVLKSSHDLFTNAVRSTLPNMRFYPAEIGGRKVKQLVQMPFQFTLTR